MVTELGIQIRKYRKEHHLTLGELAAMLDVSMNTVYLWEKGRNRPRTQNLILLSQILEISVKDIIIMSKAELS